MKLYTLTDCERLIDHYVNKHNGICTELQEGVLGLGKIILHGTESLKTIIIEEKFINPWNSGHTVRTYNTMPKKYAILLENL